MSVNIALGGLIFRIADELRNHDTETAQAILTALKVYRAGPEPRSEQGVSTAAGLCYSDVAIMIRNCLALNKHGKNAAIGSGGKVVRKP